MLLRATIMNHRGITLLLGAGLLTACDSTSVHHEPDLHPIGLEAYEIRSIGFTGSSEYTLYHDGVETVQLVERDDDFEALAELTTEAASILSSEFEAIAAGESEIGHFDESCLHVLDENEVTLTVPSYGGLLRFSYTLGCAPSGLAMIDDILVDVTLSMIDCSPSAHIVSCEILRPEHP